MHFLSTRDQEEWIKHYVDRETTVASKRVQDAGTAIMQEQEDKSNAGKPGSTTRKPEKTFDEMMNAIEDSVSNLARSDNEEHGEDEDDDEEGKVLGKLSLDEDPGWEMGTISTTVHPRMESFREKLMRIDELTQPW